MVIDKNKILPKLGNGDDNNWECNILFIVLWLDFSFFAKI